MAGKVLFRGGGIHFSRRAGRSGLGAVVGKVLFEDVSEMLGLAIEPDDFGHLCWAILLARVAADDRDERKRGQPESTRRDVVATLRAMRRIKRDDDLLHALRCCDSKTFEAIQQAHLDAVCAEINEHGYFVDANGNEHRYHPPEIEIGPDYLLSGDIGKPDCLSGMNKAVFVDLHLKRRAERKPLPVYLPAGIAGLRTAIEAALLAVEEKAETAGNKTKAYQRDLGRACIELWGRYQPEGRGKIWRTNSGNSSPLVEFADVVFNAAGLRIESKSRLVLILKLSD